MYNTFSIEAFIGKTNEDNKGALVIQFEFDGKKLQMPIAKGDIKISKLESIQKQAQILNASIQRLINEQVNDSSPRIITNDFSSKIKKAASAFEEASKSSMRARENREIQRKNREPI